MRSFWYCARNGPALKGRKAAIYRPFRAGLMSDNTRRFTSGYYLVAASPLRIRVTTEAFQPEAIHEEVKPDLLFGGVAWSGSRDSAKDGLTVLYALPLFFQSERNASKPLSVSG